MSARARRAAAKEGIDIAMSAEVVVIMGMDCKEDDVEDDEESSRLCC